MKLCWHMKHSWNSNRRWNLAWNDSNWRNDASIFRIWLRLDYFLFTKLSKRLPCLLVVASVSLFDRLFSFVELVVLFSAAGSDFANSGFLSISSRRNPSVDRLTATSKLWKILSAIDWTAVKASDTLICWVWYWTIGFC